MTRRFFIKADVNPLRPEPLAICDRCGQQSTLSALRWQHQFVGGVYQNTKRLVCSTCHDEPSLFLATPMAVADPSPIFNARPEFYTIDEASVWTLDGPPGMPGPVRMSAKASLVADLAYAKGLVPALTVNSSVVATLGYGAQMLADAACVSGLVATPSYTAQMQVSATCASGLTTVQEFIKAFAPAMSCASGLVVVPEFAKGLIPALACTSALTALFRIGAVLTATPTCASAVSATLAYVANMLSAPSCASGLSSTLKYTAHMSPAPSCASGLAAALEQVAGAVAASYVFNGTDEVMTRTLSTSSPGTTKFTYSFWVKFTDSDIANVIWQVINAPTDTSYIYVQTTNADDFLIWQNYGTDDWNIGSTDNPITNDATWYHLVIVYDSTDATAENRIKLYADGALMTDAGTEPDASEAHHLFGNGDQHQIGATLDTSQYLAGKIAFVDVVDGAALAPTDFAYDNVGTWTRKPYAGSYGTYGFCLDGTDGFNDVSGNAQHFTGVNMDASNLDDADLPPYGTP